MPICGRRGRCVIAQQIPGCGVSAFVDLKTTVALEGKTEIAKPTQSSLEERADRVRGTWPGLFTKVRCEGDEMREKTVWRALEGARAVFSRLSAAAAEDL